MQKSFQTTRISSIFRYFQNVRCICLLLFMLLLFPILGSAEYKVMIVYNRPDETRIHIDEPVVNKPVYDTHIKLKSGDLISIMAGGCVQTGGRGATWKYYVHPRGPDCGETRLYHGLLTITEAVPYGIAGSPMGITPGRISTPDLSIKPAAEECCFRYENAFSGDRPKAAGVASQAECKIYRIYPKSTDGCRSDGEGQVQEHGGCISQSVRRPNSGRQ